jgi:hypothetical protein
MRHVLLQESVKETPRSVDRIGAALPQREVDGNRITATKKQLIVSLPAEFRRANARRSQQHQPAAICQPGSLPHDLLQFLVATDKIVSAHIGQYALLSHQSLFQVFDRGICSDLCSLVSIGAILTVTFRVVKRAIRGPDDRLGRVE